MSFLEKFRENKVDEVLVLDTLQLQHLNEWELKNPDDDILYGWLSPLFCCFERCGTQENDEDTDTEMVGVMLEL